MRHAMIVRLSVLLALVVITGLAFTIGFAGATLLTRSTGAVDTHELGFTFEAARQNAAVDVPASATAAAPARTEPARYQQLDASTTAVALVCLAILLIARFGIFRRPATPKSVVIARYPRREMTRR